MRDRVAIASSSTGHHQLLTALRAFRQGDFSTRLPIASTEVDAEIAEAFNDAASFGERITGEFVQLAQMVGKSGKIRHRAEMPDATGPWAASIDAVNGLVGDLLPPTAEMVRVIEAVAKGDLSQRMTIGGDGRDLRGEFLHIGEIVNTMVDQLSSFASEVTRVAREVGTEGKLGGQADVRGVAGIWKDLTNNLNLMASNLTAQVRDIAAVTTAVANGDLSRKITVNVSGEILDLKKHY